MHPIFHKATRNGIFNRFYVGGQLTPEILLFVHNSQVFTAWKISLSDQKPFWFQMFFCFLLFFDRDGRLMMYTICWTYSLISTPEAAKGVSHKRAPDLGWFSWYSLFGPLCSLSFSKVLFTSLRAYIDDRCTIFFGTTGFYPPQSSVEAARPEEGPGSWKI